jgi:molybdenum cofactor cytidylyltransferase
VSAISRLFAIIPAAGLSRRMGQPKLLMTLSGMTIIERLLQALDHPSIICRQVVVRPSDLPLQVEVSRAGGTLLKPQEDPPDMRTSVTLALEAIQREFSPSDDDCWLLVPADHPVLDRDLIDRLIHQWHVLHPTILVPRHGQRRGHPTLFRWSLARQVPLIPVNRGLNWLLREHATEVSELPVETNAATTDLDTPEDYERLKAIWESNHELKVAQSHQGSA